MECILFSKFLVPLSIEEMGNRVKEMGFDGVDLPVRPGSQITHETAAKELPEAVKTLNEIGLSVPSIVTGLKRGDEPHAKEVLAAAAGSGVKMLRTASWSYRPGDGFDTLRTQPKDYWANMEQARRDLASLEPLCEKHGVKANMQIHSGACINCNCAATAMMLKDRNPQWIGLQIDPGHLAISGEDYDMAFAITGEYLHSVNVKSPRYYPISDQNGQFRWKIIWTPLAEGLVPWRRIMQILKDRGYDGPLSIHGEYPVEKSIELTSSLAQADLEYIRKILAEL